MSEGFKLLFVLWVFHGLGFVPLVIIEHKHKDEKRYGVIMLMSYIAGGLFIIWWR